MTQPVKPIRAWADYDLWSCYLEFEDGKLGFRRYIIPKTGMGRLTESFDLFPGVASALKGDGPKSGSLQSLRVLFDNGHELHLTRGPRRDWWIDDPSESLKAEGQFTEDKDSEAVERAMIAASAVFNPTYTPD